jgi:hypothetical protein
MPYVGFKQYQSTNISHIGLEKFYLKCKREMIDCLGEYSTIDVNQLFRFIHLFSSSLVILSLDCTDVYLVGSKNVPFNGSELQNQLIKPMEKLQHFYFYVRIYKFEDVEQTLSIFQTFPLWSVGVHRYAYLYSLPFTFPELKLFHDFQDVLSNDTTIPKDDHRLWSKVRSLKLFVTDQTDFRSLFLSIKRCMPKLSSISFY